VQEAFIKVYKNLDTFEGGSSFYTWLYRIVMNLAIDRVRSETRDLRHVEFDEKQAQDENLLTGGSPERAGNPLHRVLRGELSARIRAAMEELPEYHQTAIVLREVDGLSYEEIAEIMDCPKGTVMSRLFHARRKLQERLGPYLQGQLEIDD
jgi:RNA polymerase sigma-70 factor (ECF subfamily)